MPHGPFFARTLTGGSATPTYGASDPPETSMTCVAPGTLTLSPRKWEQTTGDTDTSTGFDNAPTKTSITVLGSTAGYANGTQYQHVFHETPAAGTIYNGGFEVATNSPTWTSGAAVTASGWTAFGSAGGGITPVEITGGKTGTVNGLAADAGSKYGYMNMTVGSNTPTVYLQLLDSTASTGLALATASVSTGAAYNTFTLTAGGAVAGRAVRIRLLVAIGASTSGYDVVNATGYGHLLSDPFIYDGTSITVRIARTFQQQSGDDTYHYYFDTISQGRADYTTASEFISQEIRMPGWTTTQEAVDKTWFRVEVDVDIPPANSALGVPTGHGARLDVYCRTGSVQGAAYSAMTDADTQVITNYTTTGLNQTVKVDIDGTPALTTRPYLRYRVVLNSGVSAPSASANTGTVTPVVKAVRIYFFNADANFYWSQETDLGSAANAFGVFNAAHTANGATITYSLRAGSTETNLHAQAWTNVTPGAVPGVAFARYVEWAVQVQPAASQSSVPTITAVSIGYTNTNETAMQPPAAAWADKRYYLQVQERNNAFNNRTLTLDQNGAWSKHTNINASCFAVWKEKLLFGLQRAAGATSNLTTGRVCQFDRFSESDDGTAIAWYVRTADFRSPDLRAPITVRGVSILGRALVPQVVPSPAGGLGSVSYIVQTGQWMCSAIGGGNPWSTQVVVMHGQGYETGEVNFAADWWASTAAVLVSGNSNSQRAQIDGITIHAWMKEPKHR